MFGPNWENSLRGNMAVEYQEQSLPEEELYVEKTERHGIIPRTIYKLFSETGEGWKISCSFMQIYNEKLYDLLQDKDSKYPLSIREDRQTGMFVQGLVEFPVTSMEQCLTLLFTGEKNRVIRQTKLNMFSSRSHTVFQLFVTNLKGGSDKCVRKAKLNLCDLAGSEKVSPEMAMSMKHLEELRSINLSLTTLGKVIAALSTRTPHVPYRDSKLTKILKDSISGNTRTCLIATVSPTAECADETISTLTFANSAKKVKTNACRNEVLTSDDVQVKRLQQELQYMKDLLQIKRRGGIGDLHRQLIILKQENSKLRSIHESAQVEAVRRENRAMREEIQRMREQQFSNTGTSLEPSWRSDFETSGHLAAEREQCMRESVRTMFTSVNAATERAIQQRRVERDRAMNTMRNTMVNSGRCPICTLPLPCSHYKSQEEAKVVETRRAEESVKVESCSASACGNERSLQDTVRSCG
eukprot:TRINITY_DN7055_c0_g1_i9.p1 TRINITY_DN7055_c0_g1~~TRINITY_DN7055_c0_g1_i9.p1  ORF type:complete len:469 (-),score=126.37 TRINITY_DN7055_c0_g1_i9:613-2019(-)